MALSFFQQKTLFFFFGLQINRNNNNNTITANHNHSHMHIPLAFTHKPVITTLKPVEEAEGPYMKMDGGMTEDWTHSETSPQQVSSPMQEDTCQTNGPPGKLYRAVYHGVNRQ